MKRNLGVLAGMLVGLVGCAMGPGYGQGQSPYVYGTASPVQLGPQGAQGAQGRHVRFNGKDLDGQQMQIVVALEQQSGGRTLPDGDYWYDPVSGAAGIWGGPVGAILPAGLPLPGPLPANASGGGTGVFINGREIHPTDLRALDMLVGAYVPPGRYWVDAQGNAGPEGGPAAVNLVVAMRQRGGGGNGGGGSYIRQSSNGDGSNSYVGGDGQTSYFFDGGSGCSVIPGDGVVC